MCEAGPEHYGDVLETAASLINSEETGLERVYEEGDVISEMGTLQYKVAFISRSLHAQFRNDRYSDSFKEELQRLGPFGLLLAVHQQENTAIPVSPALTQVEFRQVAHEMEVNMGRLNELVKRTGFNGPALVDGHPDRTAMETIGWQFVFPPLLHSTRLADWLDLSGLVNEGKGLVTSIKKKMLKMSQTCLLYTSPSQRES